MIHKTRTMAMGLRYKEIDSIKICKWMYKDSEGLRLERKYEKYLQIKKRAS